MAVILAADRQQRSAIRHDVGVFFFSSVALPCASCSHFPPSLRPSFRDRPTMPIVVIEVERRSGSDPGLRGMPGRNSGRASVPVSRRQRGRLWIHRDRRRGPGSDAPSAPALQEGSEAGDVMAAAQRDRADAEAFGARDGLVTASAVVQRPGRRRASQQATAP